MSKKRGLDNFFTASSPKKPRITTPPAPPTEAITDVETSKHPTYPFPVPHLPAALINQLAEVPASEGKEINNQLELDLLYFQPYIPRGIESELFEFLRRELFFYRVQYTIKRYGNETQINTPRYTTVCQRDHSLSALQWQMPIELIHINLRRYLA